MTDPPASSNSVHPPAPQGPLASHDASWSISPIADCIEYLFDEMALAGTLKQALVTQTGIETLFGLVAKEFRARGKSGSNVDKLVAMSAPLIPIARKHVNEGFHTVHAHALINMWAATTVAIEQTIANRLMFDESAKAACLAHLKSKRDPSQLLEEETAMNFARQLVASAIRKGPIHETFGEVFALLGVDLAGHATRDFSHLEEVRCIRNAIVHARGIVDSYAAHRVPSLQAAVGTAKKIDKVSGERYNNALCNFALCLADALIAIGQSKIAPTA